MQVGRTLQVSRLHAWVTVTIHVARCHSRAIYSLQAHPSRIYLSSLRSRPLYSMHSNPMHFSICHNFIRPFRAGCFGKEVAREHGSPFPQTGSSPLDVSPRGRMTVGGDERCVQCRDIMLKTPNTDVLSMSCDQEPSTPHRLLPCQVTHHRQVNGHDWLDWGHKNLGIEKENPPPSGTKRWGWRTQRLSQLLVMLRSADPVSQVTLRGHRSSCHFGQHQRAFAAPFRLGRLVNTSSLLPSHKTKEE